MCTAPGSAPCSYSSGSRTSSTTAPGCGDGGLGLGGVDLADAALGLVEQLAEAGHGRKAYLAGVRNSTKRRQHLADRLPEHGVGDAVEGRRLAVDDHQPGAGPLASGHDAGDRVDLQRGADGEEAGRHSSAASSARSRSSATRFWPKEIVADLRIPPHAGHGGSSSPARTRSSASLHRARGAAGEARPLPHVAVDLDDPGRVDAGGAGAGRRRSG